MTFDSTRSGTRTFSLIGAGGHARVAASSAARAGLTLAAVFDRDPQRVGQRLGSMLIEAEPETVDGLAHVAIGSNRARLHVVSSHPRTGWIAIVDPGSGLAADVAVGEGAMIGMGAQVQTGTSIGRHAIVNTGAVVDHDCVVGDFAHVAPGSVLTGGVRLGEGVLIGAGAVILPGVEIGDWATVGAGAVVTRSVKAGETVVGAPARTRIGA